jgi:hypothetical protein
MRASTDFAIGDTYVYKWLDGIKGESKSFSLRVTGITEEVVAYNNGTHLRDPIGNVYKNVTYGEYSGAEGGAAQFFAAEYAVGKKWTARYNVKGNDGRNWSTQYSFKVVGKEKITLAAGEFDAFKVEGIGANTLGANLKFTYWIAPDRVRRPLVTEFVAQGSKTGKVYTNERFELVSFNQLNEIR